MKKFIWAMLLATVVMLNTSCEEGNNEQSATTFLESEGTSMKTTKTVLEMNRYASDMKSGVSADVYKTQVAPKSQRFRGRNNLGGMLSSAVFILIDMAFEKEEKKERKR